MKERIILVTGATGFVGSHLVGELLALGERVVASNISGSLRHLENLRDKLEIARADIGCFSDVLRLVQTHRPETVYHLGAMLGPACDDNPATGIQANAIGTYHVLEAAKLFGARQVIFASSMSVFSGAYATEPVVHDFSVDPPGFCVRGRQALL